MSNRFVGLMIVLGLAVIPASAQSAANAGIPRTPDGKPDLTGYWNLTYMNNLARGKEAEVPYTPAGAAAFKNHDAKDDPTGLCLPPGVPRIMHSPFPMLIMQTPDHIGMLFEYMRIWRLIDLSGKPHNTDTGPTFMGDSTGKWEGDTLVIDTTEINDRSWLDTTGHQHSGNMHVIERLRRTPEGIAYEEIVDDPAMYAKPWSHETVWKALKPSKGLPMLLEYFCTDNNIDIQHLVPSKTAQDPQ